MNLSPDDFSSKDQQHEMKKHTLLHEQQHMYNDPKYLTLPKGVKFLLWVLFKVWRVDKGKVDILRNMRGAAPNLPPEAKEAIKRSLGKIPEPVVKKGGCIAWILGLLLILPYLLFLLMILTLITAILFFIFGTSEGKQAFDSIVEAIKNI